MGPLRGLRSREEELKRPCNLEKWKISDFLYSIVKLNCSSNEEMML